MFPDGVGVKPGRHQHLPGDVVRSLRHGRDGVRVVGPADVLGLYFDAGDGLGLAPLRVLEVARLPAPAILRGDRPGTDDQDRPNNSDEENGLGESSRLNHE